MFVVNVDWFFLSHRLPIALEALSAGYEVYIATEVTNRLEEMQSFGFKVYPLSFERGDSNPINSFKLFLEILNVYQQIKPDIVHLVTLKSVLVGGLAARIANIPRVVAAISGLGFTFSDSGLKAKLILQITKQLYRLSLNHGSVCVIVQNPQDLAIIQQLSELPSNAFKLLPGSGVDLQKFCSSPYPDGKTVVLMASRMLYSKGVEEFVIAASQLKQEGLEARFVLVGNPDLANPRSVTKEQLEKWNNEGYIEWWGHTTNMSKIISQSHIFILPSYYGEGLPKVLIEASACGRPIITTDIPGCRDAIEANVTGLLVPPKNVNQLVEAIKILVFDQKLRENMGIEGRKRAEKIFSIENIVTSHMNIYQQLLQSTY